MAKFESQSVASYALKKLDNFELPNGDKIFVEPYERNKKSNDSENSIGQIKNLIETKFPTNSTSQFVNNIEPTNSNILNNINNNLNTNNTPGGLNITDLVQKLLNPPPQQQQQQQQLQDNALNPLLLLSNILSQVNTPNILPALNLNIPDMSQLTNFLNVSGFYLRHEL